MNEILLLLFSHLFYAVISEWRNSSVEEKPESKNVTEFSTTISATTAASVTNFREIANQRSGDNTSLLQRDEVKATLNKDEIKNKRCESGIQISLVN